MRFELYDAVLECSDQRIMTVKNVTAAEEYLADHFPSFPVLPGVMMLEALVQSARRWLVASAGVRGHYVLGEVRNVRYGNMVRPGQQLRVEVEPLKNEEGRYTFAGKGMVGEGVAVQGRFVLRPIRTT